MATFGAKKQVKNQEFVSVICHLGYLKVVEWFTHMTLNNYWMRLSTIS